MLLTCFKTLAIAFERCIKHFDAFDFLLICVLKLIEQNQFTGELDFIRSFYLTMDMNKEGYKSDEDLASALQEQELNETSESESNTSDESILDKEFLQAIDDVVKQGDKDTLNQMLDFQETAYLIAKEKLNHIKGVLNKVNKKSAPDESFSITLVFGEKQMTITIKGSFTFRDIRILLWSEYGKELQSMGMTKTTVVNACVFNFHFDNKLMNDHGRRSASAWGLVENSVITITKMEKKEKKSKAKSSSSTSTKKEKKEKKGSKNDDDQ